MFCMTPGLSLFFHMSDLTNWLFLVYVGETLYMRPKGFEKTSKLLKKESWLSALEELVSFYLIYIISRGGDYSITSIEIIIDMFSRFFFNPTIKKKTKFKILTLNIIHTNHFTMMYQILFYLEKLVKTF